MPRKHWHRKGLREYAGGSKANIVVSGAQRANANLRMRGHLRLGRGDAGVVASRSLSSTTRTRWEYRRAQHMVPD